MGGFHTEKIALACLGKYLEKTGIEKVFEITETFRTGTVKSISNWGHYIRAETGVFLFEVLRIICKPGGFNESF